ncbi:unnamed protein product [Caenorhabditis brenneri]
MTTQRLKDVFQRRDQNEQMQDTMPTSAIPTPTHATSVAETCSSSSMNSTNSVPLKVETGNVKDLTKAISQKYTKNDEIEAARIRMGAYLAKKIGSKNKVECVSSDESQMTPANADKVAGGNNDATVNSSHKILKDTISCQIIPAKNDEIEAARITMEAYSAKKSGLTKTNTVAGNAT